MGEIMKVRKRNEIDNKYKWNIEKLYEDTKTWEIDFEVLKSKVPELQKFSGKLGSSEELLNFLEKDVEISRLLDKLGRYAFLRGDEDTANAEFQALKNKISAYSAEVSSASSFFIPELLALPDGTVEKLIEDSEKLKIYEVYLKKILSQKAHTLSAEQEKILASVEDCLYAGEEIYDMFTSADIVFPKIKDESGNEIELTEGNYSTFIKSKDRQIRKDAYEAYYGTYNKFKNTLATSLTASMRTCIVNGKIRRYDSALESSLKPNNIPVEVYENVVDTINNNLSSLHRYVKLKKRVLDLDEIHMYDLNVPMVESEEEYMNYEDGVEIALEGLKPLGEEYLKIFQEGIRERWIDVYENKGKCGGAYSRGCYDSMPYILMNYNNQLNDVSTVAHEMGHAIHAYYSKNAQPYMYWKYDWFCAEVASTTNECLFMDNLIKNEKDKKKKLYLINQQLDSMMGTLFSRTMLAEFEKITHESIETGNHLSADDLCKIFSDLNIKYYGTDMVLDQCVEIKWSTIPHFYFDFYMYQYVTGFAAARSFSKMIIEEGESAVERYKVFLKSGCSDYPINMLKKAGVDMTTSKPLEDAIRKFDELLDLMEKEL
ncbi:oligoendopeptidase F [Oceanirhabdus seepicola]|uniref:Oligopeptidase F n=1 Tax=Oceanirhabdus seepicola TaxID=2828781 RepID=A0A9J6P010_9CLOT|nr:oligoendopeptidase F [Oceanirhabdus seepicola]MCM1989205.1 oligoendopeptidase F [Oceanirhabdus seepicola]